MSKIQTSTVSVAMTTYNGIAFLKKQIDSILNQTYEVYEIVVCDDGSTDGTIELLNEYSQEYNLKYFINNKNLGFVKNFERSISLCSGEYIALADQDDLWYPNKIEVLLNEIEDNLLIHSDCDLIDLEDKIIVETFKGNIETHTVAEDFLFTNVVTGCTVMINHKLVEQVLPFPEGLSYHDWYLALHAAYLGKISYVSKALTGYRQHPNQDTGAGIDERSTLLRNCWLRIIGQEFNGIKASKSQVKNLRATLEIFSDDNEFYQKHLKMIKFYDDYINNFFHFHYGKYYLDKYIDPNKSFIKKLIYQFMFSLG